MVCVFALVASLLVSQYTLYNDCHDYCLLEMTFVHIRNRFNRMVADLS